MTVDIDRFSEAELIDLNRRIVERLRFLEQARAHATMLRFSIGDRVCFDADDRGTVSGIIIRYNRKSVSILADDGRRWNVGPRFLRHIVRAEAEISVTSALPAPLGDA